MEAAGCQHLGKFLPDYAVSHLWGGNFRFYFDQIQLAYLCFMHNNKWTLWVSIMSVRHHKQWTLQKCTKSYKNCYLHKSFTSRFAQSGGAVGSRWQAKFVYMSVKHLSASCGRQFTCSLSVSSESLSSSPLIVDKTVHKKIEVLEKWKKDIFISLQSM